MFQTSVYNGFSLTLPRGAANGLRNSKLVESIEENQKSYALANVESWGQARVNQCAGSLPSTFNRADASSITVYIIDTGIRSTHADFAGMINTSDGCHASFLGGNNNPSSGGYVEDGDGHGTHVASTTCGHTYGVADCNKLCAVKVLDDSGSGWNTDVMAGIEFVAANCRANDPNARCVANMSLGGGFSQAENDAVNAAVASGVVMVVAAGNSNDDACGASPASAVDAISVGAASEGDGLASFTSWGTCVDVYAPGVAITAAWHTGGTNTISGTSMGEYRQYVADTLTIPPPH